VIHLALRTEYSFKQCYGFIKDLVEVAKGDAIGIADNNNTYGHIQHHRACRKEGIKPILGVRLMVIDRPIEKKKVFGPVYIFIARNQDGLSELYSLVRLAYERFYYHPRLFQVDLQDISSDIIVIATAFTYPTRIDWIGYDQLTPQNLTESTIPKVAICRNWYTIADDRIVYQLHAGTRNIESQTFPQHILSDDEWRNIWPGCEFALQATQYIADMCEDYDLPRAPMVRYTGKVTLRELCASGARQRKINLKDPAYKNRLERELKLIEDKNFGDYFLVVAQMTRNAKMKMLVGPSRGSSAGSLVCFLTHITEVDPIKFDLLFERFIDINRADLPDIDIDFPDFKRKLVIQSLIDIYGEQHVSRIATISTMKPKRAIGEFAAGLCIPPYETDAVKGAIIERSGGDARAMMRIEDTFTTTDIGKEFIAQYPEMKVVHKIEGHARHAGVHAAGIIVCNDSLTTYGGFNQRDGALMMDHRDAESLNLLKIDCLGLRTLSILESVADQIDMPYRDYYTLPLDDQKTLDIFNTLRLTGIFQFQGNALQYVTRQMGVKSFDDICAITALARPGPIHSGGTNIFIGRSTGAEPVEYLSNHPSVIRHTEGTFGVIIYQEQLMSIGREYGGLSWEDVSELRRAASKSLGEEYFGKFKEKFVEGALKNGADHAEAESVWDSMVTFGSWGFNKSHAYGYGLISYWTAWAKAHHPLEFAVANLNNARGDDQAVKLLRDMVTNDGIEYEAFDADLSLSGWSTHEGKLIGGLQSVKGVGPKKAKALIDARNGLAKYTPSMVRVLMNPDTPFNILFPCRHYWGDIFERPEDFGLEHAPSFIEDIDGAGEFLLVGRMVDRNLRDLNETQSVARRGGKYLTDHTLFLNLILEDDTDSIVVTINRYKYERLGHEIAETGKVKHDWYMVKGIIKDKWRRVDVTEILNLNTWGKVHNLGPDAHVEVCS
jgi:DNA polymerase III alpha subunit